MKPSPTTMRIRSARANMKRRCLIPHSQYYYLYGGRGITICNEWMNSFKAFESWALSNGYKNELTLDRIDPNGNYCPENCRWIANAEQQRNRRDNVRITAFGETKCQGEWERDIRCKVSYQQLNRRIKKGWSPEVAMSTSPIIARIPVMVTAFDETKSITDWMKENRCSVTYSAIQQRLRAGWSTELAITKPSHTKFYRGVSL